MLVRWWRAVRQEGLRVHLIDTVLVLRGAVQVVIIAALLVVVMRRVEIELVGLLTVILGIPVHPV